MTSPKFQEERLTGVGGSDSAVLLGANPYKTALDLWLEKTKRRVDTVDNWRVTMGKVLEPVAADMYAEQTTGRKLYRQNQMKRCARHSYLIGHIDRRIKADSRGPGVLEIKCPGMFAFKKIQREGVPAMHQIQLQHYMLIHGWTWGAFAILCPEVGFLTIEMEFDAEIAKEIQERAAEFWCDVLADERPTTSEPKELVLPAVGGDVTKIDTPELAAAIKEMWEARELLSEASELKSACDNRVESLLGDADVVENGDTRVYHRERPGNRRFMREQFEIDWPDMNLIPYYKHGPNVKSFRPYRLKPCAK